MCHSQQHWKPCATLLHSPSTPELSQELNTEIQHFNIRYPWCPGSQECCSRAVQMSVWSSAKTSLYFRACSAQVVEVESSCAWPCAQWAGAGGDGSPHMKELSKRFPWLCICPLNPHSYSWTCLLKWRQCRKLSRNCQPFEIFILQRHFLGNLPKIATPEAEINMCLGLSCNVS